MPGKGRRNLPSTKRQARWLGAIAGGVIHVAGISQSKAKSELRGVKISRLSGSAGGKGKGKGKRKR